MELSTDELTWVNNSLAAVLGGPYAIPDWEFSSLMGGSRDEVRALLTRVHQEVGSRRRAEPQT
jgi:hypothetical protein